VHEQNASDRRYQEGRAGTSPRRKPGPRRDHVDRSNLFTRNIYVEYLNKNSAHEPQAQVSGSCRWWQSSALCS
jgi:hypothetical protein